MRLTKKSVEFFESIPQLAQPRIDISPSGTFRIFCAIENLSSLTVRKPMVFHFGHGTKFKNEFN